MDILTPEERIQSLEALVSALYERMANIEVYASNNLVGLNKRIDKLELNITQRKRPPEGGLCITA